MTNHNRNPRIQTLLISRFYGQWAYAEGRPSVPDQDPRMTSVLQVTKSDHSQMMAHVRAWASGWHDALKIQNEIRIGERPFDLRKPPSSEIAPDKEKRFRFPKS